MTSSQHARYKAYVLALAHLKDNASITNEVAAIAPVTVKAGELLDALVAADQRKIQNDTGHASHRQLHHGELAILSHSIAQAISAYAAAKRDEPLRMAATITRSGFQRSRSQELAEKSANLLTKARELGAELNTYGVTAAMLDELAARLELYNAAIRAPRNATAMRKEAGMRVEDLFKQVKQLFTRQLDPLVVVLKSGYSAFYDQYTILRKISNSGQRKTRVEGVVTDKASRAEMANVTVLVKGTELVTTTGADGRFSLYTPQLKALPVVIQKEGYKPVELETVVKRGQATALSVELERA